jgi:hypothetical protein
LAQDPLLRRALEPKIAEIAFGSANRACDGGVAHRPRSRSQTELAEQRLSDINYQTCKPQASYFQNGDYAQSQCPSVDLLSNSW